MTTAIETMTSPDYASARKAMIDSQLRTSGVNESFVLERMGAVPREEFVPQQARGTAYMDRAIRLPDGGYLPSPVFHGMMLAEARPRSDDSVLIVSNGSDYLEELVRPLVARIDSMPAQAAAALTRKRGPYSLVLIDGAVEHVPAGLAKSLAEDGRMVTGLVENGVTRVASGRRSGDGIALLRLAEIGIPRISQFDKPEAWSF